MVSFIIYKLYINKVDEGLGLVVYICNPSYLGG
jgi:hypothetical protein